MQDCEKTFSQRLTLMMPRLRRFALVLTGNQADGDDLVQSTLERALIKRRQCESASAMESWVYAISRSIWKNEIRSRVIRRGNGLETAGTLYDTSRRSDMEQQAELDALQKKLMNLPLKQREVLYLVDLIGLSYEDVSSTLNIPRGTVMSRLARGRKALLEAYRPTAGSLKQAGVDRAASRADGVLQ